MKSSIRSYIIAFSVFAALPIAWAQDQQVMNYGWGHREFQVTSTTFSEGETLPLSLVGNQCQYYPGGGNQSPELSWSNVPRGTRSFVVICYDVTAAFTHWGMYNISARTTELPENAGIAASTYGSQVANDFGDQSYDGPCPPPQYKPVSHNYVFTVYALDIVLPGLPSFGDFTPGSETLYHALIAAGRNGHILGSASIGGFFPGS